MRFNFLRMIVRALFEAFDAEAAEGNIRSNVREAIAGSTAVDSVLGHINEIALVPAKTLDKAGYKGDLVKLFGIELVKEAAQSNDRISYALENYGGYLSAVLDGVTIQEVMSTTEPLADFFKARAVKAANDFFESR